MSYVTRAGDVDEATLNGFERGISQPDMTPRPQAEVMAAADAIRPATPAPRPAAVPPRVAAAALPQPAAVAPWLAAAATRPAAAGAPR